MVKVYKHKQFAKWASKHLLDDKMLMRAAKEVCGGFFEANIGKYLYKKRLASKTKGKRGGLRTVIAFKKNNRVFYIYGYSKSKKANISQIELQASTKLAYDLINLSEINLTALLQRKILIEVKNEK